MTQQYALFDTKIGTLRRKGSHYYTYTPCTICGKTEWVRNEKAKTWRCVDCRPKKQLTPAPNPALPVGTVLRGKELGLSRQCHSYIIHACTICGKRRWQQLENGKPRRDVCKQCVGVKTSDFYNKTGRRIDAHKRGYIEIRLRSDDFYYPMSTKAPKKRRNGINIGWVLEHRLAMAKHLGRCLQSWEHVHHKNGNRSENRIENLELMINWIHHKDHSKGYQNGYLKGFTDGRSAKIQELERQVQELKLSIPMER